MLLLQVRWHSVLASIAAIVTILALGVDTFAQQVIRLDTRDVEVMDGSASFSLSRNYSGGAEWVSPIGDIERAFLALLRISHCYFADTKQQGLSM
jgi:hypothetical protein